MAELLPPAILPHNLYRESESSIFTHTHRGKSHADIPAIHHFFTLLPTFGTIFYIDFVVVECDRKRASDVHLKQHVYLYAQYYTTHLNNNKYTCTVNCMYNVARL